jgi:hypothetical protein
MSWLSLGFVVSFGSGAGPNSTPPRRLNQHVALRPEVGGQRSEIGVHGLVVEPRVEGFNCGEVARVAGAPRLTQRNGGRLATNPNLDGGKYALAPAPKRCKVKRHANKRGP